MSGREPALVIIGATGYTGRLVAHEAAGSTAPVILAARDPEKLAAIAEQVGIATTQQVDVTDEASLERLIRPGDAVINTAGPFTELGEPVIEACIAAGAHYVDITGEQPFMRAMHHKYHVPALRAEVAVVNAMAFEYALGDCAVAVTAEGLRRPLRSLDVIYAWGGAASSRGTRRTVLRMLGTRGWVRRDGGFYPQAPGSGHRTTRLASGKKLHAVAFGAGEVVTAPRYLEVDDACGWMVMGSLSARVVPILAPALPVAVPLLRPLLERAVTRKPDPTPEDRQESGFTIRVELEAADDTRRAAEVHGSDPYGITATAAVQGALRAMNPEAPAGVLAPSQLVDPRSFLDSLAPRDVRLVPDRSRG